MLEKDLKITRSQFLEGKTSLTDEDIISLLDLPPEKESRKDLKSYTDKNYSDFENDEASLQRLTENLINNSDYLLYRGSYIAKSKLLYEQSVTLCNEIPSLVIGQEIKESFYLLPYGYAKDNNQKLKKFADALDENAFTDIKRLYGTNIKNTYKKSKEQGKNVFYIISATDLSLSQSRGKLGFLINNDVKQGRDPSGKYYLYSENESSLIYLEVDKDGFFREERKFDLKKLRSVISNRPFSMRGQANTALTGTFNTLNDTNESVNTFFNSLLLRGEVEMIRSHKELQKYDLKYLNCLEALKQITNQTQSELLQNSNRLFIQSEIESEFYKDLSYKELKENPEELARLTKELTSAEYLRYKETFISKSKLLYEQSSVLYNEIPCLIVLNEMKIPAYLLPYEYAKNKQGDTRHFADSLKENTFTDFKRLFNLRLKHSFDKGLEQGRDIFFLVNNEKLDKEEIKKQLEKLIKFHKGPDKQGLFLFYSEKDYKCFSFESDYSGKITENNDYDLKKLRLAISDKPFTPNLERTNTNERPRSSNLNISPSNMSVNEFFYSLLKRGEITALASLKDLSDRENRYFEAISDMERTNNAIFSDFLKKSNTAFLLKEKQSRFYKDILKIKLQGERTMEKEKIEIQTYKFQNGETIDEILSKQTSWATDEEFLDNMIDNSLREVADFADEKENELLKKISIAKNNTEVDLKLLAVQTDAAARYMAAKHYDYRLADVGKRPFSKDFINLYAQDDFPYELPSWMRNHLEEYPNQNEPDHTSEEEKAYQEWEEMLDDNQREENDSNGQLSKFDSELSEYIAGKLPKNHIFELGFPGEILQNCGFPKEQRIELSGSHLEYKSKLKRHPFDLGEIKGLDVALQNPVAVFAYGDKTKSQNVIVNIEKEGKNFLTGIHFNQKNRGYEVSDIRTLYPKENIEWLNWINQGKMIYGNKEKLQALIAQQRMNVAEVNSQVVQSPLHEHCLESVKNILQKFGDVKEIYTDGHLFYEEIREQSKIEQKFFAYYTEKGNIDARELSSLEAEEFYNALKHNDITKIDEYKNNDFHEISELADEIYLEHFKNSVSTEEKYVIESLSEIGNAIKNDSAIILKSPTFGDVTFSKGVFGDLSKKNNGGYGINHIVEGRYVKDNLSKQDIASLLYLIKNTVETTEVDKDDSKSRQNIIKDGIWVTIRKDFDGIKQNWVVTGFAENDGNGQITTEAADAIKAVNAQYGYAPEHLFVSEQVGAVIASVNTIAQNILKSNDIERIKNFKSVYANTKFLSQIEKGLLIDNQSQLMSRGKQEKSLDSETNISQNTEKSINYHGLTLTKKDNNLSGLTPSGKPSVAEDISDKTHTPSTYININLEAVTNGLPDSHLKSSNLSFIQKEKNSQYYKDIIRQKERNVALIDKTQGDKSMPSEKKELNISEEEAVRIQLAREIRQNMPNLSDGERAAALAILEAGAASMKMTLRDYVQTTFPHGVFGDFDKAQNAAQQQGVEINGAVSVSGFGANARAVIYASKTADFSTWCHELSHIWQIQLTGELKVNAEKVFQVQNGNWQESTYTFADGHTDTSAEAFAYGFEDFLKHKAGEMAAEDKKAIFEKFADYMSRTYNGVKENIKVNEDIAKVYEQFVQLDDNILAEAEKAVRMEKDLYDSKKNINALLNSPDLRSSKKVSKTLGYVSPQFSRLAKQYGYDIEGFRHTIDNFFINHANNRHSTARTETARGNVAITNDDILNIAKVYESPDYIIFGTKTKTGNPAIVYAKNMGNATVFVEDVRSGKKELAAETLYKKSGAIDVSSKKEAPELYAHSDPESISIVDVKKEFVNHIANGELIFQAAYHGSGASFDHFDTEHYGLSGEGSMSFGWGTYLTESEAIARDYADRQNGIGKKLDSLLKKYPDLYSHITPIYNHMSLGDSFEEAKKNYVGYLRENHIPGIRKITKSIEELKAEDFAELFKKDRNLYTVSIPDGKYLSWNNDVPEATKTEIAEKLHSHLVESDPESYSGNAANYLRQELESLFESEMDGQRFYGSLADYLGSERQASEFLKESGYTGISYPAGTIYGNGNGATNYVIFNDDDIEIKEHLQFQTRTTEQKERKKIEIQTYKFQNGETIDEILSKQTSWATDEEFLDNMIDNSLREVADFADEKENELLKKISIAKNNPEVDLKLLAVQTDAAARYMAAKHYDYRLADVGNRPFSKDFINPYAQDDFPYELPSWIKNHLEEYPNQNEPEHTSEEEKAYQEWEEMLEDNQREENIISHNVLKTKDSEKNISNTQREENSYLNSEELKSSLKKALNEIAKPLEVIPFTRENYNLLFPHSHIISPIENVKLGEHQFEKLDIKERQHILKAVHDTVATPDIIINEKRKTVFDDEKEAHVYAKAFKIDGKNKAVQSVVVSIEDENVSISTHLREINNVVNKIKMPEQLIFASTEIGQMVERLTGKQLGTVNPTRENEIFAPPVTTIPQNTENSINYHGLTLTKKDNNLIEPAYDVLLISGIDDKTDSKLIEMLDNTAKWDQYCVLNKSENYIPAIAAEIVEKEKEIKNENVNKSFIQKVQDLKAKVSKSLKKNVAVGVALTSVLSANPNLFAQEKPVKLPSEQTILKEAAKEKENLLKIYKDKSPEELLKLLLEANEEKTAAKIQASNLENTVKELEVKNTKLEFYKEHYKTKSATQESFYDEMKKTQDMYESLKRSSQQDHDILYKHAKIVVNGQERVCHTGLVDGFKNCVTRLDKSLKLNKELVKENNELRKIINQSNQNERNGVSY